MYKYKQAALAIAFLTSVLSAGNYPNFSAGSVDEEDIIRSAPIVDTFERDDYDAWRHLVGKERTIERAVDPGTFHTFVAARQAARNGRYEEAIALTDKVKQTLKV
jgi:hypothetical protein